MGVDFVFQELFSQRNVFVKSHAPCDNEIDFRHNPGTLSVVEYKLELGKCIEWHQCDVSIENDDQEWAIVQDVKGRTRTVSGKVWYKKNLCTLWQLNFLLFCRECQDIKSSNYSASIKKYN